jgi:hypothetical protein
MSDIAEEWSHECDRLIEELLREAGWREPPSRCFRWLSDAG